MAISPALPAGGIIESATAFFGRSDAKTARSTNTPRQQANPENDKQERAMARRLEQLHAALGEAEAIPAKALADKKLPAAVDSGKLFGTGTLITTALISALFGAGMMGLSMPTAHTPANPPPSARTMAAPPAAVQTVPALALPAPATAEISEKTQVAELMEGWRNAWAQRNTAGYLNTYSPQFSPSDGKSRDAWVAARTKKLSAGTPIDIQIREIVLERINPDQFKATFLQDYASGNYREMARTKTLLIARENGEWKITKEWMAENKPATN